MQSTKLLLYAALILIVAAGCSGRASNSTLTGKPKMSTAQAYLTSLKDSLIAQYTAAGSPKEKQEVLDSMWVTMDEVTSKGWAVTTRSHFGRIVEHR